MASVTYLRSIANNTPYTMTLIDGEDPGMSLAIGAQSAWTGSLAVPWIGHNGEDYKAMRVILGPRAETNLFLFQDYWQPAGENAIKYLESPTMSYTSNQVQEVPGSNRGGGSKNLIFSLVGRDFKLYIA